MSDAVRYIGYTKEKREKEYGKLLWVQKVEQHVEDVDNALSRRSIIRSSGIDADFSWSGHETME
jgi:hypothetical protein